MHFQKFKTKVSDIEIPEKFTFPFYYQPHQLSKIAAEELQNYLNNQQDFQHNFGLNEQDETLIIGKMFGVLVCKNQANELGYLWAFSGKLANANHHQYFVPPIYDMLTEDNFYKKEEMILNKINTEIENILVSETYLECKNNLILTQEKAKNDLENYKINVKNNKIARDLKRIEAEKLDVESYKFIQKKLSKESQEEQILLKKMQKYWNYEIENSKQILQLIETKILKLKQLRKEKSAALQQKLFGMYLFTNSLKEQKSIGELFNNNPPAGAGECAAPKLLHYCFENELKPIAMAEFWWGKSPNSEIRQHKNYYPACKSKCEPILMQHLLKGLNLEENPFEKAPVPQKKIEIIFEDESIIIVNKPAEMLSVPGKTISESVYQYIKENFQDLSGPLVVHRLDQSTSGILLIAKSLEVYIQLQKQFINRTVKKRYVALLCKPLTEKKGKIELPIRVNLEDRPRQMVCFEHGKQAQTLWETITIEDNFTRVYFYPLSGRTHQLRVHAAHQQGLNAPIVGDDLYGEKADRLHLHAEKITFIHPKTLVEISFEVAADF